MYSSLRLEDIQKLKKPLEFKGVEIDDKLRFFKGKSFSPVKYSILIASN